MQPTKRSDRAEDLRIAHSLRNYYVNLKETYPIRRRELELQLEKIQEAVGQLEDQYTNADERIKMQEDKIKELTGPTEDARQMMSKIDKLKSQLRALGVDPDAQPLDVIG